MGYLECKKTNGKKGNAGSIKRERVVQFGLGAVQNQIKYSMPSENAADPSITASRSSTALH